MLRWVQQIFFGRKWGSEIRATTHLSTNFLRAEVARFSYLRYPPQQGGDSLGILRVSRFRQNEIPILAPPPTSKKLGKPCIITHMMSKTEIPILAPPLTSKKLGKPSIITSMMSKTEIPIWAPPPTSKKLGNPCIITPQPGRGKYARLGPPGWRQVGISRLGPPGWNSNLVFHASLAFDYPAQYYLPCPRLSPRHAHESRMQTHGNMRPQRFSETWSLV